MSITKGLFHSTIFTKPLMLLQHTGTGLFANLSLENFCIFAAELLLVSLHAVLVVCKFFLYLGVLLKLVQELLIELFPGVREVNGRLLWNHSSFDADFCDSGKPF